MPPGMDTWDFVLRLCIAALLAGVIGIDREIRNKTMGLRTLMLVCTGAALFTMLGIELTSMAKQYVEIDPTRVLQGVIAGIGLIAMGGVMHKDDRGHRRRQRLGCRRSARPAVWASVCRRPPPRPSPLSYSLFLVYLSALSSGAPASAIMSK
jgi:hypothetical protein